jgi:hypothetical protein
MCKHSNILTENSCAYCNGSYEQKIMNQQTKELEKKETFAKKSKYQKISFVNANRHKDPIEDWEMDLFVKETRPDEENIDVLYLLATELKRTFNAMNWWYELCWHADKFNELNSHALALIKRFENIKLLLTKSKKYDIII